MQDPRHSLPKAPLHEGRTGSTPTCSDSVLRRCCLDSCVMGQRTDLPESLLPSSSVRGAVGMHSSGYQGKAETCIEVTLKLLLNITRAMCLTIHLSKAHWEQESVIAPEILSTTSFGDCKFCAVSIKEETQNFSFMFIFCTKEVLHPKGKLCLNGKNTVSSELTSPCS